MNIQKFKNMDIGNQEPYLIFNLLFEIRIPLKKSWKSVIIKIGFYLHNWNKRTWFKLYLIFWTLIISGK